MDIPELHPWLNTYQEAVDLQIALADRVRVETSPNHRFNLIAGVDVSSQRGSEYCWAAVVVLDVAEMKLIEEVTAELQVKFPYIPGLLSFRELPVVLEAFRQLRTTPEVIICDGQGLAHPRFLGLACHLGLWLNITTIGCAKSKLVGEVGDLGPHRGDWQPLLYTGRIVGSVLRSRVGSRPLYISPGHLIDLKTAREVVLDCCRGTRLPEPTRSAHLSANRFRIERQAIRKGGKKRIIL